MKRPIKRVVPKAPGNRPTLAAQAAGQIVAIEDKMLLAMVADPRFLAAIPCLAAGKQALGSVGRRCGRCARRRAELTRDAMRQLRQCVAGLQGESRAKLKSLLGAQQIRVFLGSGNGITY